MGGASNFGSGSRNIIHMPIFYMALCVIAPASLCRVDSERPCRRCTEPQVRRRSNTERNRYVSRRAWRTLTRRGCRSNARITSPSFAGRPHANSAGLERRWVSVERARVDMANAGTAKHRHEYLERTPLAERKQTCQYGYCSACSLVEQILTDHITLFCVYRTGLSA